MYRFYLSGMGSDMPLKFENLLKRHTYIMRSTIDQFKRISSKKNK